MEEEFVTTLLSDGYYTVRGTGFLAGVRILNGRVDYPETSVEMKKLAGITATAFWYYAKNKGWGVVEKKHAGAGQAACSRR